MTVTSLALRSKLPATIRPLEPAEQVIVLPFDQLPVPTFQENEASLLKSSGFYLLNFRSLAYVSYNAFLSASS